MFIFLYELMKEFDRVGRNSIIFVLGKNSINSFVVYYSFVDWAFMEELGQELVDDVHKTVSFCEVLGSNIVFYAVKV